MFKYNDVETKKKLKALTTETSEFFNFVGIKKPLDVVTTKFLKRLKDFIHKEQRTKNLKVCIQNNELLSQKVIKKVRQS